MSARGPQNDRDARRGGALCHRGRRATFYTGIPSAAPDDIALQGYAEIDA
jgi:hypothetical protein